MTRSIIRVLLAKVALVMTVGLTLAPASRAQMRGYFGDADSNHDGRVTLDEFETYASTKLDTRGGLTAQRFRAMSPQEQGARLQQRFDANDSGHKGYLTQKDWTGT